jgi:hypothetical protein
VAEWTSTVDPASGWCRILGSPAAACEGTWTRAADKPSIATAGCHANYLGFRLATGPAPDSSVGPGTPLDFALGALAGVAEPAEVYKWENGALVDITPEWTNPARDLVYDVPVVFTGSGEVAYGMGAHNVAFNAGFAAPNSVLFHKGGTGALVVKGGVRGGVCDGAAGWRLCSGGALECEDVTFMGRGVQFFANDGALRLKGDNDFSGADVVFDGTVLGETSANCTNYVAAAAEPTTFRARRMTNNGPNPSEFGENVSVVLAKDYQFGGSYRLEVGGSIDAEALTILGNHDPLMCGAGTMSVGHLGYMHNTWPRLGVSNLVFTTSRPFRANRPSTKNYYGVFFAGDAIRVTSTCDWSVPARDNFGMPMYVVVDARTDQGLCTRPKVTFDGPHDVVFAPTATEATLSSTLFREPWDMVWAGGGTLTIKTPTKGDIEVAGGTAKISALPCEGKTSTSGEGRWAVDETLALSVGQRVSGAFAPGGRLIYDFAGNVAGEYLVLEGCGLAEGDVEVETSLDGAEGVSVRCDWSGGDLRLVVEPVGMRIAEWTGGGAAGNPLDPANWRVTEGGEEVPGAAPNASTLIRIAGEATLSFPSTEGFEHAGLMFADDAALAADCDWRGLGAVEFRDGAFLDLRGHRLDVGAFGAVAAGKAGVMDSTTDAEHPGELHIHVAEGATFENATARFTGNMKVVKEGRGTYVSSIGHDYAGGTLVAEGTARPHAAPSKNTTTYSHLHVKAFGDGEVAVAEGAVFDVCGNYDYNMLCLRLEGGAMANGGPDMDKSAWGGSGVASLAADSALDLAGSLVFQPKDGICDLGGHMLTVSIAYAKHLYVHDTVFTNGTIDITSGGYLHTVNAVDASTVDFKVGCALYLEGRLDVRDYEPAWGDAACNKGSAELNVHGAFRPAAHNLFYGCTMLDGSVLDLSKRTTPLPLVAEFTDAGKKTLEFASGATVKVRADAKNFRSGAKIVEWSAPPAGVRFVSDRAGLKVEAREDGLHLLKVGTCIMVR